MEDEFFKRIAETEEPREEVADDRPIGTASRRGLQRGLRELLADGGGRDEAASEREPVEREPVEREPTPRTGAAEILRRCIGAGPKRTRKRGDAPRVSRRAAVALGLAVAIGVGTVIGTTLEGGARRGSQPVEEGMVTEPSKPLAATGQRTATMTGRLGPDRPRPRSPRPSRAQPDRYTAPPPAASAEGEHFVGVDPPTHARLSEEPFGFERAAP